MQSKRITLLFLLFLITVPWEGGTWPVVYRQGFPTPHSLTTYATSNVYVYRNKNVDAIRFPKSISEETFPTHAKILQVQEKLLAAPPVFSYVNTAVVPTETKSILPEEIAGFKPLLHHPHASTLQDLGPTGIERDLLKYNKVSTVLDVPNAQLPTITRISHSNPAPGQPSIDTAKLLENISNNNSRKENSKLSDIIQLPPRAEVNRPSTLDSIENDRYLLTDNHENNNGNQGQSHISPIFPEDDKKELPFNKGNGSINDFKSDDNESDDKIAGFTTTPTTTTISTEKYDFDFPLNLHTTNANGSLSSSDPKPKLDDGGIARPDLLDLLEEIKKLERMREEGSNTNKNFNSVPEVRPQMQNRQDFGIEQPSPFLPGDFNKRIPTQNQGAFSFEDEQTTLPQQQHLPQDLQNPSFSLPAPPQYQTSDFLPGANRLPNPNQPPQPENQPLLPSAPQFQTNMFFPSHNRFGLPPQPNSQQFPQTNGPQQQFPSAFNSFQRSNPFGFSRSPPPPQHEPENGYNPYHMFEMFPEPPYESEFGNEPRIVDENQGRNRFSNNDDALNQPQLDFAQSTLRNVRTEEILNAIQRKPVPPDCSYNTISYGPKGEDCVQRKKRDALM